MKEEHRGGGWRRGGKKGPWGAAVEKNGDIRRKKRGLLFPHVRGRITLSG